MPLRYSNNFSQLRDTYIEISNYFRGRCLTSPYYLHSSSRQPTLRFQRSPSEKQFSTWNSFKSPPSASSSRDVTHGFPTPPSAQDTPESTTEEQGTSPQSLDPISNPRLTLDAGADSLVRAARTVKQSLFSVRPDKMLDSTHESEPLEPTIALKKKVQQLKHLTQPFPQTTLSWDMLEETKSTLAVGDSIPVILYGYITSKRPTRKEADFMQFVDPQLRKAIQLIIRKDKGRIFDNNLGLVDAGSWQVRHHEEQHVPADLSEHAGGEGGTQIFTETVQNMTSLENADDFSESVGNKSHGSSLEARTVKMDTSALEQDARPAAEETSNSQREDAYGGRYGVLRAHTPVVVIGHAVRLPNKPSTVEIAQKGIGDSSYISPLELQDAEGRPTTRPVLDPYVGRVNYIDWLDINVSKIRILNYFPIDCIAKAETVFPPEKRHLQFRTKSELRNTIRLRSKAMAEIRKYMFMKGFDEIETPLLFKSTPEGAREFIVPTRRKGMAYALPQSPQQYKQLLMASGISRYFQLAKCFRDEDMRADRQPEFTQLDLEMSFAQPHDVMFIVERLITQILWPTFFNRTPFSTKQKDDPPLRSSHVGSDATILFQTLSYESAMRSYGSDKPDTRLRSKIRQITTLIPKALVKMLSPLDSPIVEIIKVETGKLGPSRSGRFITEFLEAPSSAQFLQNPAGAPGITVFDTRKPLQGLASFGHEGADRIIEMLTPEEGDILVVQARPDVPFTGGSTPLGNLRRDIHQAAFEQMLLPQPTNDSFLWVIDFPLFSPVSGTDPGQGGEAGICSTHHPFTAPKTSFDGQIMFTDPLRAKADHFDLVINGVEIGGGSRRIHNHEIQETILRDVLKMKPERIEDFRHLLDALKAGCPPHTGFALGFDRLMAILTRQNSVRDVIAFPKWGAGDDKMVGAPSLLSEDQLRTYHLGVRG